MVRTLHPPRATEEADLPIDPRIRQRRAEVRRAQGRRRLRLLLGLLGVTVLVVGGLLLLHSPVLGVGRVTVSGDPLVGTPALLRAAGIRRHEPLIDVAPARAERRLEALPWVATARVVRHWPGSLALTVTARHAVGQVPRDGSVRGPVALVDATGRVVADAAAPVGNLPLLLGVGPAVPPGQWLAGSPGRPGATGAATPGPQPAAALALASALDADHLAATKVELGGDGTAVAIIDGGATSVLFGPATGLPGKLAVLRALAARGALQGAGQVDLAAPARPTVTPKGATTRHHTTSGGGHGASGGAGSPTAPSGSSGASTTGTTGTKG